MSDTLANFRGYLRFCPACRMRTPHKPRYDREHISIVCADCDGVSNTVDYHTAWARIRAAVDQVEE